MFYRNNWEDKERLINQVSKVLKNEGFQFHKDFLQPDELAVYNVICKEIVPLFCDYKASLAYLDELNEALQYAVSDIPNIEFTYPASSVNKLRWPLPDIKNEFKHPKKYQALHKIILAELQQYGFNKDVASLFENESAVDRHKFFPVLKTVGLVSGNILEKSLRKKFIFSDTKAIRPALMHGDMHLIQFYILIKFIENNFENLKNEYQLNVTDVGQLLGNIFSLLLHEEFRSFKDTPLWDSVLDFACMQIGEKIMAGIGFPVWQLNGPHSPFALHATLLDDDHPHQYIRQYLLLSWTKHLEKIRVLMGMKTIKEAFEYSTEIHLHAYPNNTDSKISPAEIMRAMREKKEVFVVAEDNENLWDKESSGSYVIIKGLN